VGLHYRGTSSSQPLRLHQFDVTTEGEAPTMSERHAELREVPKGNSQA
jgi:hypothetical protein